MTDKNNQTVVSRLSRLHAALLTPYDADGNISDRCLRRLIGHVKAQGIDGFYIGGSTGEGLLQTTQERLDIFATVAEAAGDSPLIGHVGALSTREAQVLAKGCAAQGYDAVSAIPPIYFSYKKDDIFGYYQDILDAAAGTPLIIYNVPALSGVTFTLDDLGRLLAMPCVIGIKQTTIDMYQMEQIQRAFPDALLLNGYDEMLLAGVASGAKGGVGSTYNVMGRIYSQLMGKLTQGDVVGARGFQSQANDVLDELVRIGVFPGLKYLAHRLGVIETPVCRKPLATLRDATSGRLNEIATRLAEDFAGLAN